MPAECDVRYRRALRTEAVVRWAGILVWGANSLQLLLPLVVDVGSSPVPLPLALLLVGVLGSFLAGTLWILGPGIETPKRTRLVALLAWLSVVGVLVNDLFQVVSLMLPLALSRRVATIWFVAGNVVTLVIYAIVQAYAEPPRPLVANVIEVLSPLAWRFVAFAVGVMLAGDRQRRQALARATEHRARLEERLEISRELHDSIGHHLVALNTQLELARHQTEGAARETVREAQAAGRRMLGEVRSIVSTWRADTVPEVGAALRALAGQLQTPAVLVDVPPGLEVTDAHAARALIRCAQEIVTNAIRHAEAQHVWLELRAAAGGIELVGRDDGRGCDVVTLGNGLRGLGERAEALHGRVDVRARPNGGFEVAMWLPVAP